MKKIEKLEIMAALVALVSLIAFFVALLAAIWIGMTGVKVMLSAAVVFTASALTFKAIGEAKKNIQQKKEEQENDRGSSTNLSV